MLAPCPRPADNFADRRRPCFQRGDRRHLGRRTRQPCVAPSARSLRKTCAGSSPALTSSSAMNASPSAWTSLAGRVSARRKPNHCLLNRNHAAPRTCPLSRSRVRYAERPPRPAICCGFASEACSARAASAKSKRLLPEHAGRNFEPRSNGSALAERDYALYFVRMAPASRPVPAPSRRYEKNNAGWQAVQRPHASIPGGGTPAAAS